MLLGSCSVYVFETGRVERFNGEGVLGRRELAWPEAKRAYHRGGSS
jgi:hypothetical protein